MLGNRVLPESVVTRRRRMRERLSNLRRPVKQFRRENVPGPDVVGQVESSVMDLRDRFVTRNSMMDRMKERRDSGTSQNESSEPERPGSPDKGDSAV